MPQAQFSYPTAHPKPILITKTFPTPKLVGDLWRGWYKSARRAIAEIPVLGEPLNSGRIWRSQDLPTVSENYIRFNLENDIGERAYLVIARKVSNMG